MSLEIHSTSNDLFIEEDMPESYSQVNLFKYLSNVLDNFYWLKNCFVMGNVAIYPPKDKAYPFTNIAPDLAIFIGITLSEEERRNLSSWQMSEPNRPAPDVVFEISSEGTWTQDLDLKPDYYRLLGVKEYFAYDPQRLWRGATTQLRGWRYVNNQMEEIQPDERGWLWSVLLDSWLASDGVYLRLYDAQGNLRLTGEEAERAAKEAERAAKEVALQLEHEARQREQEARQREQEARQREQEAQQQKQEALQREQEAQQRKQEALQREQEAQQQKQEALQREQALLEKLRKAGIDIDNL